MWNPGEDALLKEFIWKWVLLFKLSKIQNAILTAIDSIITPKIELAIRSKNASSGRDVTSVMRILERGEHIRISASSKNASERNNTLHVFTNDETRINILGEQPHFDRQPYTHHRLMLESLIVAMAFSVD